MRTLAELGFALPGRPLVAGFWHCSASDRTEHDDVSVMRRWHLERGFAEVGYHAFVRRDGTIQPGRDWAMTPAAQAGHNSGSLAFCLHGLSIERFTGAQLAAMRELSCAVDEALAESGRSRLRWRGHCEVAAKLCPVVNYQAVLGLDLGGRIGPAGVIPAPYTERVRDPRALNIGDRGPRVAQVQQALILAGAFLVRDGIYGRATRAAVESYQHSKGLTVDGIVGPATLAALGV